MGWEKGKSEFFHCGKKGRIGLGRRLTVLETGRLTEKRNGQGAGS